MRETNSTCCYCGVGCGVVIQSDGERIVGVRGDPDHPANFGRLCTKGQTLHLSAARVQARARHPLLRRSRGQARTRVAWDEALDHAARRFAAIIGESGPDSVAFYISGQLLTEDYYVFNKLAKGLIGTNNIDTNSRLCMSSAVTGYKATLGADAPPACYEDIERAECVLIAGSNTAHAHPILYGRLAEARRRRPRLRVIVVDPRRTATAAEADLHLALAPGSDIALFNAMLHVMLEENLVDRAYIGRSTEGFEELARAARDCAPEAAAAICGVPERDIVTAARWFARSQASLSLYCQGLNQSAHGAANNEAIINLHLATGQIGRPGAGPFSLTGQPNAMGGREVGGMANLLSAHRDLANPVHRAEVARLWNVPEVPARPGKTAVELFRALREGEVRALWIACTNPAQSMPDLAAVREALERADFVVVQDAYRHTETTAYADLLLPASSWGEKEGTATNSERRITRVRAAVPPPGEARADWEIAADFARRLGAALGRVDAVRLFPYRSPEEIFNEHRASTRARDLDITGLSYALLEERGPQQWPFPEGASEGRARLYAEGVFPTPSARARFVAARHQAVWEAPDADFPLRLNTGRLRDQWHGMSRSGTVARLFAHAPEPTLAMHPRDMASRSLGSGDCAQVTSRRGSIVVRVGASEEQREGEIFLPMHWGSRFSASAGANALTVAALDPRSKQPELKHAAVQVERVELAHQLAAIRGIGESDWDLVERLHALLPRFTYAALALFGDERTGVVLRARSARAFDDAAIAAIDEALGIANDSRAIVYFDRARAVSKRWLLENGRLLGARLAGDVASLPWLQEKIASGAGSLSPREILAPAPFRAARAL